ncbi:hypothetical protein JNUCC0626_40290 [Lentzea sp. JNUCC 0626]|uniref:hypothetical protein n=1 Tax=Lentzea sp. JNUCC 0626 TaxID=3367513 RepID=UPI003749975C
MTTVQIDVHALAEEVASELGEGWSARVGKGSGNMDAFLDGPNGIAVQMLHEPWGRRGPKFITIKWSFGDLDEYVNYGEGKGDIGASVGKAPNKVAGDIRRRLLPGLNEFMAVVRERKRMADERKADRRALATVIAGGFGPDVVPVEPYRVRFGGLDSPVYAVVNTDHDRDSVWFDVRVPRASAVSLAEAIAWL